MRRAQVVLALVLLIGGLALLMSLTVSFLSRSHVGSAYGILPASRARYAALSGIHDGLLQVARDPATGSAAYTLSIDGVSAAVSISAGTPSSEFATIAANSAVLSRQSSFAAIVTTSPGTAVRLISLTEIP